MTRSRDLEDRIEAVSRLRGTPPSEEGRALVRDALGGKAGRLVARGAEVAGAWADRALVPDLVRSFERLFGMAESAAAKADAGCGAKTGIVDALGRIGEDPAEGTVPERVFLPGASHRQWESVWGGRVDTAGALRGACAAGLVAWPHPEALVVLADHLADPLADVRASAARSVGRRGQADGVPLLRLRLRLGDEEPRVMGECCRGLLSLAPAASLLLVAELLDAEDEELFGEAALALGESRLPGACDALCGAWRITFGRERRRVLLAALAALRREEAVGFLLRRVEEEASDVACDAVEVLAAYAGEAELRARVAAAVQRAADDALTRCFDANFGPDEQAGAGGRPRARAE